MAAKPTKERANARMGPRYDWQTKRVRQAGKSPNIGPGLHRTNMVGHDPEDQRRRPLRRRACRSLGEGSLRRRLTGGQATSSVKNAIRTTLCGSEVPQDRWRGRTAGSGMWTRTENLLSWSPSGDSAIPYG